MLDLRPLSHGPRPPLIWLFKLRLTDDRLKNFIMDRPVYAFEYPGRRGLLKQKSVADIASRYLDQLLAVQTDGPYWLAGYSFGGTIAFEMARQCRARGKTVELLFMLDCLSPGTPYSEPRRVKRTAITMARLALGLPVDRNMRWPYMWSIYGRALAAYWPTPFEGKVVYVKSKERPAEHVEKWQKLCLGGFEAHELPGNHETVVNEDWLKILKGAIKNVMRENP